MNTNNLNSSRNANNKKIYIDLRKTEYQYFKVRDCAELLGCTVKTVYNYIKKNKLRYICFGTSYRIAFTKLEIAKLQKKKENNQIISLDEE